jgi:hypothetical protein
VNILQIVPRLPPPAEGVGNYALALARALAERCGISTRFLAAEPPEGGGWETAGLQASVLPAEARAAALVRRLAEGEEGAVLLHYANYGYQRRGCPFWLLDALRRRPRGRRLVTVFHEVYATSPPWRSAFWTFPFQRRIAAGTARASDALVTSLDLYVQRIGPAAAGKTAVTPVFSTVGEPPEPPPLASRARRMVLFGGRGARSRAYGELRRELLAACRVLGIEEIADVGPPLERMEEVDGIPVRRLGVLPAAEASRLLLASLAGFVAYPAFFLPKSSIFAAYCAHGMLPVQAWRRRSPEGVPAPFWSGSGDLQGIADAARGWYVGHSLERQAERFRDLLTA